MSTKDYSSILERRLISDDMLQATMREAGLLVNDNAPLDEMSQRELSNLRKNLSLEAKGDNVLEITLKGERPTHIQRVLETITFLFIDDLLAPERFAVEDEVSQLADQARFLNQKVEATQTALDAAQVELKKAKDETRMAELSIRTENLTFELETLSLQQQLAREKYQEALRKTQARMASPAIRPLTTPTITNPNNESQRHRELMLYGLISGLVFILVIIILDIMLDKSLRTNREIEDALGVRVLGRMPYLGKVSITDGGRIASARKVNL